MDAPWCRFLIMFMMLRSGCFPACLLVVLLASCQSSSEMPSEPLPAAALTLRENAPLVAPALTFAPGDVLELFVKEDATLNGSYPVREGGYIVIPRAGRIQVAGLDRTQAESRVKEVLQRTQLTEATVLVERTAKHAGLAQGTTPIAAMPKVMVFLTGAVPRSGAHHIPLPNGRSLGVYEALLITGGMNKFAREDRVEIFRTDSQGRRRRAVVDLRPVRIGQADDPPVGEGDVIHVPEKVFGF
jgi:protein involved in polysaccharide export with SLBB domain